MGNQEQNAVNEAMALEHGLSKEEYARLVDTLGRTPSYTELGIVSVMWSEHCSYKSSREHLKNLPTEAPWVLIGPGENAGVIDVGDDQAVVFKMESHNHPSFIEPHQGAATGVGGICRDVFTMGARPIAIADCLRFGEASHSKTAFLVSGVVSGIAGYGNSFGVPTVAGDVGFHESYNGNILVNAFCLGVANKNKIFTAAAEGIDNPVVYVGAKTGRDGIHGATMASAEFDDETESKRPSVQVGDPFMEKLLLEACLELMESDAVVGIQDMGAAGLTSSSVEMAARSGAGIVLDLEKVPQREEGMTPYEICLSESQERMLMVLRKGREEEALTIFAKWDLDAAVVGQVTNSGRVVIQNHGEVFADLPAEFLAEGLRYQRPKERPDYLESVRRIDPCAQIEATKAILTLLGSPNIASKEWVFSQYDYNVRSGTILRPGAAGAGVVRLPEVPGRKRRKGVAISAGCNSRWVYLDPYEGTRLCVAEAYANLAAVGAKPLAATNCLNFGNPEKPGIMWQFAESVRGLGSACNELSTPIISGNVSLYNETDGVAIRPTPMLAMVGVVDDVARTAKTAFPDQSVSDAVVFLVGSPAGSLAGSEYLAVCHGQEKGLLPELDAVRHKRTCDAVSKSIAEGVVLSAQDISDGGLAVAAAECCILGKIGADLVLPKGSGSPEDLLFGEAPGRFLLATTKDQAQALSQLLTKDDVLFAQIGTVGGRELGISIEGSANRLVLSLEEMSVAWRRGFQNATVGAL